MPQVSYSSQRIGGSCDTAIDTGLAWTTLAWLRTRKQDRCCDPCLAAKRLLFRKLSAYRRRSTLKLERRRHYASVIPLYAYIHVRQDGTGSDLPALRPERRSGFRPAPRFSFWA